MNSDLEPAADKPASTTFVGNLLLVVGAVVVALLICELILRLLGVEYPVVVWTDPVRGVAHVPGARTGPRQSDGGRLVEINHQGWRGPDVPFQHRAGTYRVALLGDSFIEAFEVPFQQTVGQVIARRLSALRGQPVEVLNFGEGGYGTTQELLTLRDEVWKYAPDLVVLAVTTGNDISDNSRRLKQIDYVPYFVFQGSELVLDTSFRQSPAYRSRAVWTRRLLPLMQHSRLAQLVNRVRHLGRREERAIHNAGEAIGQEVGLRDEVHLPPRTPEWEQAWRVTEGVLRLMRDECRTHGTPLAIVTLSRGIQVNPDPQRRASFLRHLGAPDLYYAERRLAEFGGREGIPVFNAAPPMAADAETRGVFFHADHGVPGKGHWNAEGHRVAGTLIASWLAEAFPARQAERRSASAPAKASR